MQYIEKTEIKINYRKTMITTTNFMNKLSKTIPNKTIHIFNSVI